jgi:putative membrane protein
MFTMHHLHATVVLALGLTAMASSDNQVPSADIEFVGRATSGILFEMEASKLVKTFADRMLADHAKAHKDLMEAAKKAQIDLPTKMAEIDQKRFAKIWDAKEGTREKVYLESLGKGHEEAVVLYTKAAATAKDSALREYARKTLPVIKEHSEHIKKCVSEIKSSPQ